MNSNLAKAQSPGNVSTNLGLWLKGGSYATAPDHNDIRTPWIDQSGNSRDAVYRALPAWFEISPNINFNYSVAFNDDWFDSPLDINVPEVNVFMVYKLKTSSGSVPLWGNGLNTNTSNHGKRAFSNRFSRGGTNFTSNYNNANAANTVYINHISSKDGGNSFVYVNGTSPLNTGTGTTVDIGNLHSGIFIGKDRDATPLSVGNNDLDVAEFIVYTGELNQAEREQINSYLAIKYGVTLPHDYSINSGNTVVWDRMANTGYNNNITGIAKDNSSSLDQKQSKSENAGSVLTLSILGMGATSDQQALVVGDNGALSSTSAPFQSPDNYFERGERMGLVWKCQKTTGFTLDVNLEIDNGISLPTTFGTGEVVLLVADDDAFTTNLKAYPVINGASNYEFANVTLEDGQYFTLAHCDVALWTMADGANITGGGNITKLDDNVFGMNDLTSVQGKRPKYEATTDLINFHSYVKCNQGNTGRYLQKTNFIGLGNSGVSSFLVVRRDNTNNRTNEALLSYAVTGQDNEMLIIDPSNLSLAIDGITSGTPRYASNLSIVHDKPQIFTNIRGNGLDNHILLNGTGNVGTYKNSTVVDSRGRLIFGQEQDPPGGIFDPGEQYQGDYAEMIIFNKRVSDLERKKIESYLAIKYGITLDGNYELNNTTVWNQTTNTTYHNDVAGIGRDDDFSLDQRKSTSQNGTGVDLTIEHVGALTTDHSFLIWGHNGGTYDNMTTANAPSGYKTSEKVWKVQNLSNKVGGVTVSLNVPPSMASHRDDLRLLVDNNTGFSTAIGYPNTTATNANTATFENVILKDGDYFTLALVENPTYLNHDPGAPLTFEACSGSKVTFRYGVGTGLANIPDGVELRNKTGLPIFLSSTDITVANTVTSGANSGTIQFTIPDSAGTGSVKFLHNGAVEAVFPSILVIHNPDVDFFVQQSLVCATDTVPVIGVPSGGVFTATGYPDLFDNDNLLGTNALWTAANDPSKNIPVIYSYRPSYNGGSLCAQPIEKDKTVEIKDNRIDELLFRPIVSSTAVPSLNDRLPLTLSSNIVRSIEPDLGTSLPLSFSGTYVNQDTFLTDLAGFGQHSVQLEYNNGGCIGAIDATIEVLPPPAITGIVDTLCRMANPITLGRDITNYPRQPIYFKIFHYHDNTGAPIQVQKIYNVNERIQFNTLNPAYQAALSLTGNIDVGVSSFDPQHSSLSGVPYVVFESKYETVITTIIPGSPPSPQSDIITVLDTIYLQDKPTFNTSLSAFYCENSLPDTLHPTPALNHNANNTFSLKFADPVTGNYTVSGTLIQDTIFDPAQYYTTYTHNSNNVLKAQLAYETDYYGCHDVTTELTEIKPAPTVSVTGLGTDYCINGATGTLLGSPTSGGNGSYSGSGIDATTGVFTPAAAGIGAKTLRYTFTATNGCIGEDSAATTVRPIPTPSITTPANNATFLTTDGPQLLVGAAPGGTFTSSPTGAITTISGGNPAFDPGAGAGIYVVTYDLVDAHGCQGSTSNTYIVNDAAGLVTYTNNDYAIASASFEACPNTSVTFSYDGLMAHPDQIEFIDNQGNPLVVSVTATPLPSTSQPKGTVSLPIPLTAKTGKYKLWNGSMLLYTSSSNLIIHNPSLELVIPQTLICATDTISVVGVPSGGTISAVNSTLYPNLFDNNQLIGLNANWSTQNDSVKNIGIQYSYTPTYYDGTVCGQAIITTKNIDIRDNRLDQLDFNSIVSDSLVPTEGDRIALDLNAFSVSPHFDASYNFPLTFSGTFVNAKDTFLTDYAGFGTYPIHVEYDNGGCIGVIDSDIDVLSPLNLLGLVDDLCREAAPIDFYRDTAARYTYSTTVETDTLVNGNIQTTYIELNKVDSVVTQDAANRAVIQVVSNTPSLGHYRFIPDSLPVSTNRVVVEIHYISTTIIEELDVNGLLINRDTTKSPFKGSHVVNITNRPPINFSLDNFYCSNAPNHLLNPMPQFDNLTTTYFVVKSDQTTAGTYDSLTQLQGDVFDPQQIYTHQTPPTGRDLNIQLIYHVDKYGCSDSDTLYTKIIEPIAVGFTIQNQQAYYCTNHTPSELTGSFPASIVGTEQFLVADTLNSPSIITDAAGTFYFDPNLAGEGIHRVTYEFTDTFGCKNLSANQTFEVKTPPQIRLEVGGQFTSPVLLCANDTDILLSTTILSGGDPLSINYTSASNLLDITNDTLNARGSLLPNQTNVIDFVRVNFVDSFLCAVSDFVRVEISKPIVDITGFTNNSSPASLIDSRYCNNESDFVITATPDSSMGIAATLTGGGVYLDASGIYHYNPNYTNVNSFLIDTVEYTFTDSSGCSNTIEKIIQIDSIPVVDLLGLDSAYCISNNSVTLQGVPSMATTSGNSIYSGPGINPNLGTFTSSTAGVGTQIVEYTFIDNNGCQNTVSDTTVVHGLPIPQFSNPATQYCTADGLDTLTSSNLPSVNSSYRFWGNIIDSIGIINPSLALTAGGVGTQTIFYTYVDSLGCTDTISVDVTVNRTPEIIVNGLDSAYCFNAPNDNILVSPSGGSFQNSHSSFSLNGNTISFIPSHDTTTVREFTYVYTDNITACTNSLRGETFVYRIPSPSYSGLDSFYCETTESYPISGIPLGGAFSGAGISLDSANSQYYFSPINAGAGGHVVDYKIDSIILHNLDTLACEVQVNIPITVRPLPDATIIGAGDNHRFCSNEEDTLLLGGSLVPTWDLFKDDLGGIILKIDTTIDFNTSTFSIDTSYYFSPSSAGGGTHVVTYIATDSISGCQDSTEHVYFVTDYIEPTITNLNAEYCESDDPVSLGGIPAGTQLFLRNSDTLAAPPQFIPNPNYGASNLTTTITDTVIYIVNYGKCTSVDTQLVLVKPVPSISFIGGTGGNVYCLEDTVTNIPLIANVQGGNFTGNGVLFSNSSFSFIPSYAGVGNHPIAYTYVDQTTGCDNTYQDTFRVLGLPNLAFDVIGGCESDTVLFYPNNDILGVSNVLYDSITNIQWEFEPGVVVNAQNNLNNHTIDTVSHVFNTPGVYWTKLYVENQNYCRDTATARLVISPKVTSFPYDETFESSAGNWYAESRSDAHPLLWEWGIDSASNGIVNGIHDQGNKIWTTAPNRPHSENEDAWVYSPCFDISNLERPMIRLDYWSSTFKGQNGTVLEYQKMDGTWAPLGRLGRGINWFDSPTIGGSPGDQLIAPIGWSGETKGWTNARYMLDEYQFNKKLRLRMAFGSNAIVLGNDYDGFAFDNVWIGNRTRNVLLETTVNVNEPDMGIINDHVYQLAFHSPINKDLVLLQYHCKEPLPNDIFHQDNTDVANTRVYYYSGNSASAGKAFIDGRGDNVPESGYLRAIDFERDMLESPKFNIRIHPTTPSQTSSVKTVTATVTALADMPEDRYYIHTVISEDSLRYSSSINADMVHAVVREDDGGADSHIFHQSWEKGDSVEVTFAWDYSTHPSSPTLPVPNYDPDNFEVVVFIQSVSKKDIFQVETSRDKSDYWVGVDKVKAEPDLNEIMGMNLYPNPARDYVNVSFEKMLKKDYQWKLVTLNGIEVKSGLIEQGTQTLEINSADLPTGVYIFVALNENVFSQRKVIINRN